MLNPTPIDLPLYGVVSCIVRIPDNTIFPIRVACLPENKITTKLQQIDTSQYKLELMATVAEPAHISLYIIDNLGRIILASIVIIVIPAEQPLITFKLG